MMALFSDREGGPPPRTEEEIRSEAWLAIWAVLRARITNGSFGIEFPMHCQDGEAVIGTDQATLLSRMLGVIGAIREFFPNGETEPVGTPPTMAILDLVEFMHRYVAKPIHSHFHSYFGHHHLTFDCDTGQAEYRSEINEAFARNGLAYELNEAGNIERLGPVGLGDELRQATFRTRDNILDGLLEDARRRYLSPDLSERRIALEKLWDAFERIKTLEHSDKRQGVRILLDRACNPTTSPNLRQQLEEDAKELTSLGNELQIRHHEVGKEAIMTSGQVDYLFGRMFQWIRLVLRTSDRGG